MKRVAREIGFAILAWLIPFAVSVCIFSLKAAHEPLFDTLMGVTLTSSTIALAVTYFKRLTANYLAHGVRIGITWAVANWIFDGLMFSSGPNENEPKSVRGRHWHRIPRDSSDDCRPGNSCQHGRQSRIRQITRLLYRPRKRIDAGTSVILEGHLVLGTFCFTSGARDSKTDSAGVVPRDENSPSCLLPRLRAVVSLWFIFVAKSRPRRHEKHGEGKSGSKATGARLRALWLNIAHCPADAHGL